jgi:hypothetical protein
VNLPATLLGVSLEPMGSTATRRAYIRDAREIGFDIVHVIDDRCDDRWDVTTDHTADSSYRTGNPVTEASYELLKLAGQQRNLVAIGSLSGTAEEVAARAKDARSKLDDLGLQFDFAFSFLQVSIDDPADLSVIRRLLPDMPEAQMRELATVLSSPVASAACRVRWLRDVVGVSYFTFHKSSATSCTVPVARLSDALLNHPRVSVMAQRAQQVNQLPTV